MTLHLAWTFPLAAIIYLVTLDGVQVAQRQGAWPAGSAIGVDVTWPADTLQHELRVQYVNEPAGLSAPSNAVVGRAFAGDTVHVVTLDGAPMKWRSGPGLVHADLRPDEWRRCEIVPQLVLQLAHRPRICALYGYWTEAGGRRPCP